MWSNFFLQQDGHGHPGAQGVGTGAGAKGDGGRRRPPKMSDTQEGKIKLAFFVAIVGVTLTVLGVGTEFWVQLAQPKTFSGNHTCQLAHYGLWKGCTKTLWVADIDPDRATCGPEELHGETNCTYFKFFTSGESAVIFGKTANKNLNLSAAVLALFSLTMMVMGSICITMSISKSVPFFLKPASFCFILSGILILLSIVVFHQSVLALLASDHTVPLHHELSWSVSCVGAAGAILILGGVLFLLLSLPYSPFQKCLPRGDGGAT